MNQYIFNCGIVEIRKVKDMYWANEDSYRLQGVVSVVSNSVHAARSQAEKLFFKEYDFIRSVDHMGNSNARLTLTEVHAQITEGKMLDEGYRVSRADNPIKNPDFGMIHEEKFTVIGDLREAYYHLKDKYEDPFASKAAKENP